MRVEKTRLQITEVQLLLDRCYRITRGVIRLRTAGVDLDHMDLKKFNWIKLPGEA
jgi:hypothetical protein